jgi:hypothetical protein
VNTVKNQDCNIFKKIDNVDYIWFHLHVQWFKCWNSWWMFGILFVVWIVLWSIDTPLWTSTESYVENYKESKIIWFTFWSLVRFIWWIVLYACEIWGYEIINIVERVHFRILKHQIYRIFWVYCKQYKSGFWSVTIQDKAAYQISVQYLHPMWRKVRKTDYFVSSRSLI